MTIESKRDNIIYKIVVPVAGAILGAIAAVWIKQAWDDHQQLNDISALMKDPGLTAAQKMQALAIHKEITDRPWGVIRSVVSTATTVAVVLGMAFAMKINRN